MFSVPRDSVERACRPLRESHHRTWFTMDALLATARRPVSDRGEPRCLGERRRSSTRRRGRHKRHCRSGIMILHAECPAIAEGNSRSCFRLYLPKHAQIADPEVAKFGQLSPTRLLKAQQAKIPHKKAKASGPDQTPPRGD